MEFLPQMVPSQLGLISIQGLGNPGNAQLLTFTYGSQTPEGTAFYLSIFLRVLSWPNTALNPLC